MVLYDVTSLQNRTTGTTQSRQKHADCPTARKPVSRACSAQTPVIHPTMAKHKWEVVCTHRSVVGIPSLELLNDWLKEMDAGRSLFGDVLASERSQRLLRQTNHDSRQRLTRPTRLNEGRGGAVLVGPPPSTRCSRHQQTAATYVTPLHARKHSSRGRIKVGIRGGFQGIAG
jgi:hypothetical protein